MNPAQVLEQPRAGAEEHGHEMHMNLVDAAGPQQLPADAGAEHVDVPVTGGGRCQLEGLDGTVHECVHAFPGYVPRRAVGDDERRCAGFAAGPVRAPPGHGQVVGAPAGDGGSHGARALGQDVMTSLVSAEGPLVQLLAAVSHRLLGPDACRGHITIERHTDVKNCRHMPPPLSAGLSLNQAELLPHSLSRSWESPGVAAGRQPLRVRSMKLHEPAHRWAPCHTLRWHRLRSSRCKVLPSPGRGFIGGAQWRPHGMARSAGSAPGSGPGGGGDDRSAMSSCRQDRYRPGRRWRIDLAGPAGVHDRLACGGSRKPRVAVPRRPYAPGLFLELGPPATRHPVTSPGPWPIWVGRQSSANSRTQGLLLNPVTARWPDSRGTPARGPRR